jgi:hypothetical protein
MEEMRGPCQTQTLDSTSTHALVGLTAELDACYQHGLAQLLGDDLRDLKWHVRDGNGDRQP